MHGSALVRGITQFRQLSDDVLMLRLLCQLFLHGETDALRTHLQFEAVIHLP